MRISALYDSSPSASFFVAFVSLSSGFVSHSEMKYDSTAHTAMVTANTAAYVLNCPSRIAKTDEMS